jgi:homoserine O-acetyltransferase/O-succinyltransferase
VVHTTGTYILPAPLPLEGGGLVNGAQIPWATYGRAGAEGPTVVLLHDLCGSHLALGRSALPLGGAAGWALPLAQADGALRLQTQRVVCPGLLGSRLGVSGGAGRPASEGSLEGARLCLQDIARATAGVLRGLGVEEAQAVVGVGLGGAVALELAALFPKLARGVVTLGTAASLPERLRERLAIAPQLLRADHTADAQEARQRQQRALRRLWLELYAPELLDRPERAGEPFPEDAEAFAAAFDPRSIAALAPAYGRADLNPVLDRVGAEVLLVAASSDPLAPPSRVRDAYHRLTAAGVKAHYSELQTELGHPGLTRESGRLCAPLREFLSRLR